MIKKLLAICFIFVSLAVKADSLYHFRTWDVSNGLSDNTVKCIAQDKFGFLWLGTFNGLCRFDGQRFTTFRRGENAGGSLPDSEISTLSCGGDGVWIGTMAGPCFYAFSDARFHPCFMDNKRLTVNVKTISSNAGYTVMLDINGHLYFRTKALSFKKFQSNEKWYSFAHYKNQFYWAHSSSGLYLLDVSRGRIVSRCLYSVKGKSEVIYYSHNQKLLYIGGGLDGRTDVFRLKGTQPQKLNITVPDKVKAILDYGDNTLFGTDGDGLKVLGKGHYSSMQSVSAMGSDAIFSLYKDCQGNLLLGTYRGGLCLYSPQHEIMQSLTKANGKLSGNVVTAICRTGSDIYVGLDGGGLNIYDTKTGKTRCLNTSNSPLPGNNLLSIVGDGANVWLGLYKEGLCRYEPATGRFYSYPLPGNAGLWVVKEARDGFLWGVGPNTFRFNKKTLRYEEVPSLHGAAASDVCFDGHTVWISTVGKGVFQLSGDGRLLRHFTRVGAGKEGLKSNRVRFMYIDSRRRKWFVTDEQAFYILEEDAAGHSHWKRVKNELSASRIVSIEEEKPGIFWLGTYNGLFRFDERANAFTRFLKTNGLPSVQFNYNASYQSPDGTFYWGTTAGLVYFEPRKVSFSSSRFPICFTELRLSDGMGTVIGLPDGREEVRLPYDKNFFTINFSVPDITNSDKLRYAYCMKNFDSQWRYVETPQAEYTNLPPGEYDFCVRATDASGRWGQDVATLHLVITPPWWKTWWAIALWYILAAAIIYFAVRLYLHELDIKHSLHIQKIRREAEERNERSKMDFLVNVVHELRTPVFLLSAPLEELMASGKRVVQAPLSYIQGIYSNVLRLNKLLDRIIDFKKIESGALQLQLRQFDAVSYCKTLSLDYRRLCQQKHIEFTFEASQPFMPLVADVSKLDSILSNLVSNAFKYTPEGGTVSLSISEQGGFALFSVKDNGIGIAPVHQDAIFKEFYQINADNSPIPGDGIGLTFVRRLVELHGGTVTVKSHENEGAEFLFTIPLGLKENVSADHKSEELEMEGLQRGSEKMETSSSKVELDSPAAIHSVLLIDNDADTVDLLAHCLKDEFKVYRAANGTEGLDKVHELLPDIIIMDIMMPQMDGMAFLSALKHDKMLCSIPVIVLTGDTSEESKVRLFENGGVEAYLNKPVSLKYLRERIDYLLAQSEKRKVSSFDSLFMKGQYNTEEQRFILRCRRIVDENLSSITVKGLAEELGMSQSPLYKKMKELTGLTVIEFISSYRIFKAVQYFKQGETNIGNVCVRCGFNDPKNFRETFKRKMKMTPREFIKTL